MAGDDLAGLPAATGIDWQDKVVGMARYGGGDKTMVVVFYMHPQHQPTESAAKGRQIFKDVVYVRIQAPGERLNIIDRPATESDAKRFPMQWAAFKQNQIQIPDGTPIEQLYPDKPSIAATLRAYGVHTIEMCSDLSGHAIDNIGMGAQTYVNDARKYIEVANRGVSVTEMRRAMEQKDREIARLTTNIGNLTAQVDKLIGERGGAPSMEMIAQAVSQVLGRPVHTPQMKLDPQAAMIAANHKTTDIVRAKNTTKGKPKEEVKVRHRGKIR